MKNVLTLKNVESEGEEEKEKSAYFERFNHSVSTAIASTRVRASLYMEHIHMTNFEAGCSTCWGSLALLAPTTQYENATTWFGWLLPAHQWVLV